VLQENCLQAARWAREFPDRAPLTTAVNLSARQLGRSDLPEMVEDALKHSGADPSRLLLEITESALIGDAEAAASSMDSLRSLGVALGIDDFGTGYASLTYLKKLPVDVLKVHGSFVQGLEHNHGDRAIVRAGHRARRQPQAQGRGRGRRDAQAADQAAIAWVQPRAGLLLCQASAGRGHKPAPRDRPPLVTLVKGSLFEPM